MPNPSKSEPAAKHAAPSGFTAVLLAWILPGLGHWLIGERVRAIYFFVVITVTFWAGVAVGGVRSTVAPRENGAWIAAQLCAGPHALIALLINREISKRPDAEQLKSAWPASNIGVVYAGVAGLLNLLVIIDVLTRLDRANEPAPARAPPARSGD